MSTLKELRTQLADAKSAGRTILQAAKAEGRDTTETEEKTLAELDSKIAGINASIEREEQRQERERQYEIVGEAVRVTGGEDRIAQDPKRGFRSFGQFAGAVMRGAARGAALDKRLTIGAAPTSTANEGTGADGGFLVPPDFSSQIVSDMEDGSVLFPLVDDSTVSGNGMVFPADEDTAWSTSGIRVYWEGEGQQATQSNPLLKSKELRLRKLFGLVPITEELAADATAVESYVESKAGAALAYALDDAFVNGGAGRPQGVVGHGGTVSVAKEGSQTAATVNITNVVKMFAAGARPQRMRWFANIDTFPQLFDMKDNSGNRVYQTAVAGLPDNPMGLLLGRPLTFLESCPTLGTVGDLIFADWSQYKVITKGGPQTATSMHLWFDYDVMAFRVTYRIDGQPWRASTITPAKGSAARGHFVTLATRS